MRRILAALAGSAALAGLLLVRRRLLVVSVRGISMAPALSPGDRLLVRRRPGTVRPGDIVVLRLPRTEGSDDWALKRVAAVGGDPEPEWLPGRRAGGRVSPGHLVVLGDNADVSLDSRDLGAIPADRLVGVVRRLLVPRPARSAIGQRTLVRSAGGDAPVPPDREST